MQDKGPDKWDVDETETSEEDEADVVIFDINYYPADITLSGYRDKLEAETMLVPEFQREFVWNQVQASKLIESFLLGLPVPGVFLYQERRSKKLQIIDGQQRILSSVFFQQGVFQERKFRLKGVLRKWEGKTFEELSEPEQLQLQDSVLRATIIQQLEPNDDSSIYHIFERLNTGGIKLNPMEIRKCVSFGDYYKFLETCNELSEWRSIIGRDKADNRLRDVEFILRIFALHERYEIYTKPMKGFLNSYMSAKKKSVESNFADLYKQFEAACAYVLQQCGPRPFNLRGRLNYAVMDSVMVAAIRAVELEIPDFGERLEKLVSDPDFVRDATINTSDETTLKNRFKKAFQILLE